LELAGCCDADADRAQRYAKAFGFARHHVEISAMLAAEKPDAVVMAVPPHATGSTASLVLERGIPLLIEKPPGLTPAELRGMIAAAQRGGTSAQVAFNRHYMPVMVRAREILDAEFPSDSVGRIDYEMTRFNRWDPDFSTTAIHALDGALFLARSPFRTAELSFQSQRQGDREAMNVVVSAECVSAWRVLVIIQPVAGRNAESAEIHAVGQSLMVKPPISPQSQANGALEHWRDDGLVASFSDSASDAVERLGVLGETRAFLGAVRSGTGFRPQLESCHQQVALMEAIRLRQSGPIRFAPD
jgi:predicted dehydrogenase